MPPTGPGGSGAGHRGAAGVSSSGPAGAAAAVCDLPKGNHPETPTGRGSGAGHWCALGMGAA
eukprot:1996281-Alexandrium_andersonii.AAC.1